MEVFKCQEFPNMTFKSPTEMFMTLKQFEHELIALKKSHTFKSCEKHQMGLLNVDMLKVTGASKSFEVKKDFIYPVISTTNYFDTHKDGHLNGCFNRTIDRQQGKVMYALDHELKFDSILAWEKDVEMFKAMIDWALVGKSYPGQTEGLVFGIHKDAITRKDVLAAIENKSSQFENSIRMNYEDVFLAINSNEKELAQNKALFDSHIGMFVNKENAYEDGYFYGVRELRINKEGSLVVAGGSNDATSIITLDPADSPSSKQKIGSPEGPQSVKSVYDLFLTN